MCCLLFFFESRFVDEISQEIPHLVNAFFNQKTIGQL